MTGLAYGIQRLQDSQLGYKRTTTPVWMRFRNFDDVTSQQFSMLGFGIQPNPDTNPVGTTDVRVNPPPAVSTMSLHNIGISGGKLRFGAKSFMISATFVTAQMAALHLTDPAQLFRQCLGLVNDSMLYSIEDIQHEMVQGVITGWFLVCNSNELR